mmetsp:Transcript_9403/g.17861  ORF Transcript_9403/g.17861 Transcript_9403/m.17861 type:complete len:649 (-) Transcript_9403:80-2026(-)
MVRFLRLLTVVGCFAGAVGAGAPPLQEPPPIVHPIRAHKPPPNQHRPPNNQRTPQGGPGHAPRTNNRFSNQHRGGSQRDNIAKQTHQQIRQKSHQVYQQRRKKALDAQARLRNRQRPGLPPKPPPHPPALHLKTEQKADLEPVALDPKTFQPSGIKPRPPQAVRSRRRAPLFTLSNPFTLDDNKNWETGGSAEVVNNGPQTMVQITKQGVANSAGFLRAKAESHMVDWELTFSFSALGRQDYGGIGFALWYTAEPVVPGAVYGGGEVWNGLGVVFDVFAGGSSHPVIAAHYNDGTMPFQPQSASAVCSAALRNAKTVSHARVTYLHKKLAVELSFETGSGNKPVFHPCLNTPMSLGVDKYFTITAMTGAAPLTSHSAPPVADTHLIYNVETYDLTSQKLSKADIEAVRREHQQEVEHRHRQNPGHKDLEAGQFQHAMLGMLHQVQGAQKLLDTSQGQMNSLLSQIAQKQLGEQAETVLGKNSAQVDSILAELMRSQQEMSQTIFDACTAGDLMGKVDAVKSQSAKTREIISSTQSLVLEQAQQGPGGSSGTTALVRQIVEKHLGTYASDQETLFKEVREGIAEKYNRQSSERDLLVAHEVASSIHRAGLLEAPGTSWLLRGSLLVTVFVIIYLVWLKRTEAKEEAKFL